MKRRKFREIALVKLGTVFRREGRCNAGVDHDELVYETIDGALVVIGGDHAVADIHDLIRDAQQKTRRKKAGAR